VCHLVIDSQDVLITVTTLAAGGPTCDAVTYWDLARDRPSGDDPLDALTRAVGLEDPRPPVSHLDNVGSTAGRAAVSVDPGLRVATRGKVLTAADYLGAYVMEWTLHHFDLIAHLPGALPPPAESVARSRAMLDASLILG
jgi:mycothiol maleylpyruvate isomerase-like protein